MADSPTPSQKRLGAALVKLAERLGGITTKMKIDWQHVIDQAEKSQPALDRYKHALKNPDDPKSEPWLALGDMTPRQAEPFIPWLPDILKRRGRPKGSKIAAEIEKAVAAGEEESAAASRLIAAAPGEKRHRRDYIKKLRKPGKK